jgi:hypothetical protein
MSYVRVAGRRQEGAALASVNPCPVTATDSVRGPRGADALPHLRVTPIAERS